ncbi:MAG: LysR family transcriptional regulator [Clostridiales bacterium]|nr:LysR family transcriptional regulator [Clostridiales bacterium]
MNLIQLKYFVTIYEQGSVLKASEKLNISQPSISIALKELEAEFETALFQRQHKGMTPTEEGEELYKLAQSLLEQADELKRVIKDLGDGRKVLRLGVPPMIGLAVLPVLYSEFAKENPDVQLEIKEAGREELVKLLKENRVDMVLLPHNAGFDNDLINLEILEYEIVCCVSNKRKISNKDMITAKDLVKEPLVLFNNSFFQTEEIKKWFSKEKITPNILIQTSQLSTMQKMIEAGLATGFMFKHLIQPEMGIKTFSMQRPLYVKVSLVWNAKAKLLRPMKKLITFMKKW